MVVQIVFKELLMQKLWILTFKYSIILVNFEQKTVFDKGYVKTVFLVHEPFRVVAEMNEASSVFFLIEGENPSN